MIPRRNTPETLACNPEPSSTSVHSFGRLRPTLAGLCVWVKTSSEWTAAWNGLALLLLLSLRRNGVELCGPF
jgi:hypothetical protein